MLGNIVSSVCMCQLTPLKMAIGVFLGGRKYSITELYKYRICCSFDEVRRFLRSADVKTATYKVSASLSDASFGRLVQVIMDNFDRIIPSQNSFIWFVDWNADILIHKKHVDKKRIWSEWSHL